MKDVRTFDFKRVTERLKSRKDRSTWQRGVNKYAFVLAMDYQEGIRLGFFDATVDFDTFTHNLLNETKNWYEFCEEFCTEYNTQDIVERLFPPSQQKMMIRFYEIDPIRELKDQAAALEQACRRLWGSMSLYKYVVNE